jgi:hypothetical protein
MALFVDPCVSANCIIPALSCNYLFDRTVMTPSRSQASAIFSESFTGLPGANGWVSVHSGSGAIPAIYSSGSGDPAVTTALQLACGAVGGDSHVAIAHIPNPPSGAYSFMMLPDVGGLTDPLYMLFQDGDARLIALGLSSAGIFLSQATGSPVCLSTHAHVGGPYELWIGIGAMVSGVTPVTIWLGTQLVSTTNVTLPFAGLGTGFIQVQLSNPTTANQIGRLFQLNIGPSQLSDQLVACYGPLTTAIDYRAIALSFDFEDVSRSCTPQCSLQADTGTPQPVTIIKGTEILSGGIVDNTANVYYWSGLISAATLGFSGGKIPASTVLRPRYVLPAGQLGAYHAVGVDGTAYWE